MPKQLAPQKMTFHVGPWRYPVRIADQPLANEQGRPLLGTCVEWPRLIEISPTCPRGRRLEVLLHELAHAWIFSVGEPYGLEAMADFIGTLAAAAMQDLNRQGGERALRAMRPAPAGRAGASDRVAAKASKKRQTSTIGRPADPRSNGVMARRFFTSGATHPPARESW